MVDELAKRRWRQNTDPNAHKPVDALKVILADIEAGTLDAKHIVITYVDRKNVVGYYQAGEIESVFGSIGVLHHALKLMGDSSDD